MKSSFFLLAFLLLPFSLAQTDVETLVQERLETIPLPDPVTYYGQNDAFAAEISAAYCDAALADKRYLGEDGWIFTRAREIDFGRERLGTKDLSYNEIVFWLSEYRQALETVGFDEAVMMVVPSKALLGQAYLTDELQGTLEELATEDTYQTMRQAYVDAGFTHVPDLLQIARDAAEGTFPHYPIDHHFTPHSALQWAAEVAKIIMQSEAYAELELTPVTLALEDRTFEVVGWEHMRQVWQVCQAEYPKVYMPYYALEYEGDAPGLFGEVESEIVVVGNSNIGFEFNRPGSSGEDVTPGTGTSDFLAHLTHLPVLKYGVFSLANSAIEQYVRTDFFDESPPGFLVQYLEAHVYPYPAYHYRSLPALTYGKCQNPVFEATVERKARVNIDLSAAELEGDSSNYYVWLELDQPAQQQSVWIVREQYENGWDDSLLLDTDDRFIEFPISFGLQLLPEQGKLNQLNITPEQEWSGTSVSASLCDIRQVRQAYEALGRFFSF